MADLKEIKQQITNDFVNNETIKQQYELTPGNTFEQEFSKVSLEWIIFDIVSFAIWSMYQLWNIFKSEIETEMAQQKIHSKEWYRQKALDFQYGFSLIPGTDKYNNINYTDEQIEASKVVKQAACIKLISGAGFGILRIKVAGDDGNGNLTQLPPPQYEAVKHYFLRYVVDAGTQLTVTTGVADDLMLTLDVYYDALVLTPTGERRDGTAETPVKDAIVDFLKSLEFNGALYVGDLVRAIRAVDGVELAKCKEARSKYGSYDYWTEDVQNVGLIDEIRVADSGYMKLDLDMLQINYKVMEG